MSDFFFVYNILIISWKYVCVFHSQSKTLCKYEVNNEHKKKNVINMMYNQARIVKSVLEKEFHCLMENDELIKK